MDRNLISSINTSSVLTMVEKCEDLSDFRNEILEQLSNQRDSWKNKINELIAASGHTKTQFAELCKISPVSLRKWCSGVIPRNRDSFLKIGFASGYNLDEMNFFLQRFGQYPKLYAKSLEDCVCIYILNIYGKKATFEQYSELLYRMKNVLAQENQEEAELMSTSDALHIVTDMTKEEELRSFIQSNQFMFLSAYRDLYSYIEANIDTNTIDLLTFQHSSVNELATDQQWTSSMNHVVSAIRQRKWFPAREKLISLCLHLNMDVDEINTALSLAKMEPLYPKRPLEAAIIYAVQDAELNDIIVGYGTNDLCKYVCEVLRKLDISESENFLNDITIEDEQLTESE